MSGSARRFQRRGQPIVGEHLDAVEARYRNPQGQCFHLEINSESDFDAHRLYTPLRGIVTEVLLVGEAFEELDALAASPLDQQKMTFEEALHPLFTVHWLAHHGHLPSEGRGGGMLFRFSRPHPTEPDQRVGFIRQTMDPTPGQETAFARSMHGGAGTLVKDGDDGSNREPPRAV